ncbi:atrial natriuretic peptide receptor 2-like [Paramacrobiotus metropolitanus]|uniref:atrial natriuretic peptide receptor 2-like n=1 Tax=Paramacrobiotus metropolitanus TaxID=2943436 RepID=UPI0024464E25|nr:atrial natriuretic peptide receptor 2-like [Paramacrobiotus metropolitanus]
MDAVIDDFGLLVLAAYGLSDLTAFLAGFLEQQGYQHASIFRDDSYPYFVTMTEVFLKFIRTRNPVLYRNVYTLAVSSKTATGSQLRDLLWSANNRSRVMIIFGHADCVRKLLVAAHAMNMTKGKHMYLAVELYALDFWGTISATTGDQWDPVATQAYQSLLVASVFETAVPFYQEQFDRDMKFLAQSKYNFTFAPTEKADIILTAFYEAIIMYADIVDRLWRWNQNYTDGVLINSQIVNASFRRPLQKDDIVFRIGPDRQRNRDYCMKFYNSETDQFQIFLTHQPQLNQTFQYIHELPWPSADGHLPPDEPWCGFRGDKCRGLSPPALAGVAVGVIFVVTIVVAGSVVYYVEVWKQRTKYDPNWWKISVEDLQVTNTRTDSGSKRTMVSKSTGHQSGASSNGVELFGKYGGEKVGLVDVSARQQTATQQLIDDLNTVRSIKHTNLQRIIGVALDVKNMCIYVVGELCAKGCLTDILENEIIQLDWFFKNSLIRDIVHGMAHLHSTPVVSHGSLTSNSCLIDARFTLKIGDYGLTVFRDPADLSPPKPADDKREWGSLLWRAPELLRQTMPVKGTQKGDVYSFAILLQQIILRSSPFELPDDPLELSDKEIVLEVIAANIPPVRPRVPRSACSSDLYELMEAAWQESPVDRPTFAKIKDRLAKFMGRVGEHLVDLLLQRMEQYAVDLEAKIVEQTRHFLEEKARSEQLLSQLLPKSVASALTKGLAIPPESFDSATVFFSDVVGFTRIASQLRPISVVDLLNGLYTLCDRTLEQYDVYKVETTGDNYMVASGLPIRNGTKHVVEIAVMALRLLKEISHFEIPERSNERLQLRTGINSGSVVAGIVGSKMPRYCLFGDTVNVASRMESTGEPMKIQATATTRDLLDSLGGFLLLERGPIFVKGKGKMITYWLIGEADS